MRIIKVPTLSSEIELLQLKDDATPQSVSFYPQGVQAGFPNASDSIRDITLSLDEKYLQHPESTFLIRVVGDSMNPTLMENDILVVKSNVELTNGCIAILSLNESAFTVKRFDRAGKQLLADNSKFPPINLGEEDTLISLGVVKHLIRDI